VQPDLQGSFPQIERFKVSKAFARLGLKGFNSVFLKI
jgi:hypothetical protein